MRDTSKTGLSAGKANCIRVLSRVLRLVANIWVAAGVTVVPMVALAENAAESGKLMQEYPTLKCLGLRWLIGGDENQNCKVLVEYRKVGAKKWKRGMDLFRVEREGMRKPTRPPEGETLFAGSIFDLEEGTEYEVKLSLRDPDGGNTEKLLRMKTWSEPRLPISGRRVDVHPGKFQEVLSKAEPGDTLLLHRGIYQGTFKLKSGAPGKPIAIVGAGDGKVIIDGKGASNTIHAPGVHDVMLENLTIRNAKWGINFNGGARISIRRCIIKDVEYGIVAQLNAESQHRIFIADNIIEGRSTWPRTQGIESRRGIQISGQGNVVCYNRVSNFGDGIDTFSTYPCAAIDIYGNEISECTDDGIEMDYSEHNTRCFDNRLTNIFQGITIQPIYGGPVYIFRNALYNVERETFKMHNGPSGALMFHNTSVKAGMPLVLYCSPPVSNCIYRNNLFVGTSGRYGYESTAPMRNCDFDYDGFAGRWGNFLKWNRVIYKTMADVRRSAPTYRHVVRVNPVGLFQSGLMPPPSHIKQYPTTINDLRLKRGSDAIDRGAVIPNINDHYKGKAPDLGAYELGQQLPHYGPRPRVSPVASR